MQNPYLKEKLDVWKMSLDTLPMSGGQGIARSKCLEGQAESGGEVGVVAADRTGLFQGSGLAVAGRMAEADGPGLFGKGEAPVLRSSPTGGIWARHGCPS